MDERAPRRAVREEEDRAAQRPDRRDVDLRGRRRAAAVGRAGRVGAVEERRLAAAEVFVQVDEARELGEAVLEGVVDIGRARAAADAGPGPRAVDVRPVRAYDGNNFF